MTERLEKHHTIWRCLGKIWKSKELHNAIQDPKHKKLVTHEQHLIENAETSEIAVFLQRYKGKPFTEKTIYKFDK